jgi:hypothetical protein
VRKHALSVTSFVRNQIDNDLAAGDSAGYATRLEKSLPVFFDAKTSSFLVLGRRSGNRDQGRHCPL